MRVKQTPAAEQEAQDVAPGLLPAQTMHASMPAGE
jgi:hypothetical protein